MSSLVHELYFCFLYWRLDYNSYHGWVWYWKEAGPYSLPDDLELYFLNTYGSKSYD